MGPILEYSQNANLITINVIERRDQAEAGHV